MTLSSCGRKFTIQAEVNSRRKQHETLGLFAVGEQVPLDHFYYADALLECPAFWARDGVF